MGWRKGKPRRMPDPRKRKFAQLLASGSRITNKKSARQTLEAAGLDAEWTDRGGDWSVEQARRLLKDPEVQAELLARLRGYARTWEELEELSRAVIGRQLMGVNADGGPIEGEPIEIENLQQKVALGSLAIMSRNNPEALASRARQEDQARTMEQMARALVGDSAGKSAPDLEPARPVLSEPSDEDVH